jgi:hypothetical protein
MEYPKMLYHNGDVTKQRIVNSVEEEDALGDDWIDQPIDPASMQIDEPRPV